MNKISICGVVVISNLMVCDVCVFHASVYGEMKLFAVLWFLVWLGDAVFVNFFAVLQCSGPPHCALLTQDGRIFNRRSRSYFS